MLIWLFVLFIQWNGIASTVHLDTANTGIQTNEPQSTVMWHMPRHARHVALTFDDGPDRGHDGAILVSVWRHF